MAIEAAKRQVNIEFHLLGYGYRHLQTQPRAKLTVHGQYEEADLPGLLQWLQPDLVWFPAQWPETYSYTLSAALQAALPVVVSDLGAFAERIAGRPWSWVVRWDLSAKEWVDTFASLQAQHFVPGTPPAITEAEAQTSGNAGVGGAGEWHYRSAYLADDIASRRASATGLGSNALQAYLPQPDAALGAKSGLLSAVVYLRSLPVLRSVAQRIPGHWQRRVKNWLRA